MDKQIVFTKVNTAELLDVDERMPESGEVKVKTFFSTVSCGTERANITGDPSCSPGEGKQVVFPKCMGYSSSGIVEEVGEGVTSVQKGDRVVVYWGVHKSHNIVPEQNVVKIEDDAISFEEAAVSFISTFPMAAIRKTRLEMGESCLVMGLGLLGQLAVNLARVAGAVPIVAVDPVPERREEAMKNGADYAFDPFEEGFADKVKAVTDGGAKVAIEVTGVGAGFDGALDCMAKFGRVALLGCTRNSNFTIDYYRKIHGPGITVVGAHTIARPDNESYPGYFTHRDDIKASLKLCSCGRLEFQSMIKETHSPDDCASVYTRLVEDRNFPVLVQFDWNRL
ncbi:MAG: zinc-binding alcohol dehydrogenase [Ruminococcaceae bacterium]|nr:zinc-binding alcohol dehydrogenase [Oscillospiraceae bacterium]